MSSTGLNDELNGELAAPHFEDRLWDALAEAHGRNESRPPTGRRPHRPAARRGRRVLVAGVGSLAAAVALVVAVAVTDPGRDDGVTAGEQTGGAQDEVDLATRITSATQEAIADSVVHVIDDQTGIGDAESWSDEASGVARWLSYDGDGAPSYDSGAAEAPAVDAVGPPPLPPDDERCLSWSELAQSPSTTVPEPEGCGEPFTFPPDWPTVPTRTVDHCFDEYVESQQPALPAWNEAEQVGEALASGELVEDGTEVVDGRELIRLRSPGTWAGQLPERTYHVDPETYRPVQLQRYPDENGVPLYVMTFEYLPRTPENLALLVSPPPEGFTQVDALHTDGERLAAGCGF